MEVLSLEREAVYRRIREEVPFSFGEIAILAQTFHISLDNIVGIGADTGRASGCLVMHMNFLNQPQKEDYDILETLVFYFKLIKGSPYSEFGFIGNTVPQLFYLNYEYLYKLHLLKWDFQTNNPERRKPLKDIIPPERLKELNTSYQQEIRHSTKSSIIFDRNTFRTLVSDILFFYQVRLITKEELIKLKEELQALLEEINQVAITGAFTTGKPVDIYISHLNIYTTNLYFHIDTISSLAMLQSFALPDTISMEETTIKKMKIWLDSFQRSSIQISQSGEAQRIHFFDEQFNLLNQIGK